MTGNHSRGAKKRISILEGRRSVVSMIPGDCRYLDAELGNNSGQKLAESQHLAIFGSPNISNSWKSIYREKLHLSF